MKNSLVTLSTLLLAANAQAATWQWTWVPAAGDGAPRVEVCPLKYGKTWAYAVEIDDGPASTLTVSQPLLARYRWNDAPPGVAGGTDRTFVGAAAVSFSGLDTGNSTRLNLAQIDKLKQSGWSVVNHSYWHTGNHWDKSKFLKPEDFKRELFWSQAFFAHLVGGGRAATHFVFPNGDFHYGPHLTAYGLRSASRVSGSSPRNLLDPRANLLDWTRNYLDTEVWVRQNNPLTGLPEKPQAGDFIIDFTHGMNADPQSVNNKLWVQRLDHIARSWGAQGDNSMWVAPTDEVVNYSIAAREAKLSIARGSLTVDLPDTAPGAALTLKISGVGQGTILKAPQGGTLYRQGDTVWLTTPLIGEPGAPPPEPRLRRVYAGEAKTIDFDKPVSIAAVRLRQSGPVAEGFSLNLDVVTPDDKVESIVPGDKAKIAPAWGSWLLFPTIPDRAAPLAKSLRVTTDKNLREMEVWVVDSATATPDQKPVQTPALLAPYHKPIVLDGDLADWKDVPFVPVTPQTSVFDLEAPPTAAADDLSFRFALCHDNEALYVAVEVTDDAIHADSTKPGDTNAPAWEDDAIEVFIDGNHNHAPDARAKDGSELAFGGEFSLVINGAAMSGFSGFPNSFGKADHWQGATNWAALQKGEKTLRYEYRLAWNVMGGKVRPGDTIGFTVAAQDDDDGGRRDHSFYWKGISPHCWRDESGWGDVYLQPQPAAATK